MFIRRKKKVEDPDVPSGITSIKYGVSHDHGHGEQRPWSGERRHTPGNYNQEPVNYNMGTQPQGPGDYNWGQQPELPDIYNRRPMQEPHHPPPQHGRPPQHGPPTPHGPPGPPDDYNRWPMQGSPGPLANYDVGREQMYPGQQSIYKKEKSYLSSQPDERDASCSRWGPSSSCERHQEFAPYPSQRKNLPSQTPQVRHLDSVERAAAQPSNVIDQIGKRNTEVAIDYGDYEEFAPANKMAKTSALEILGPQPPGSNLSKSKRKKLVCAMFGPQPFGAKLSAKQRNQLKLAISELQPPRPKLTKKQKQEIKWATPRAELSKKHTKNQQLSIFGPRPHGAKIFTGEKLSEENLKNLKWSPFGPQPTRKKLSIEQKKPLKLAISELQPPKKQKKEEIWVNVEVETPRPEFVVDDSVIIPRKAGNFAKEVYGQELRKLKPMEVLELVKQFDNFKLQKGSLHCDICKPCKYKESWKEVKDYLKHHFNLKHIEVEKTNLRKIDDILYVLKCDAKLGYVREHGMWSTELKKQEMCEICSVPKGEGENDHMKIRECWINHEYAQPKNCCYPGHFFHRHNYFYHCFTLTHLKKEGDYRLAEIEDETKQKNKLKYAREEMRAALTTGHEVGLDVDFKSSFVAMEAQIYKGFGTLPVPEEVKSLLDGCEKCNDISRPKQTKTRFLNNAEVQFMYYDPFVATGKFQLTFETQFGCSLCYKELGSSKQSVIDHCATLEHFESLYGSTSRLRKEEQFNMTMTKKARKTLERNARKIQLGKMMDEI